MLWSGNECVKSKRVRIATQPPPVTIRIEQKQLENWEYFSCLGSVVTNYASCARESKSRIAMAKAAFNKKTCHQQMELKFKAESNEHSFVWCRNLDTSENRSEISGKFWNVVLEKDGEDQLDRSREKWRSVTQESMSRGISYMKSENGSLIG